MPGNDSRKYLSLALHQVDHLRVHCGPQVAHLPPLVLWVCGIELNKQLGVREVKTTATVISHGISGIGDIKICLKVAVMILAERTEF